MNNNDFTRYEPYQIYNPSIVEDESLPQNKAFKQVTKIMRDSGLSYKDINKVLCTANGVLYNEITQQTKLFLK